MARRGYGVTNLSKEDFWGGNGRWNAARPRKERLAEYDTTRAKTVLAVVGGMLVLVLLWLDYRGY